MAEEGAPLKRGDVVVQSGQAPWIHSNPENQQLSGILLEKAPLYKAASRAERKLIMNDFVPELMTQNNFRFVKAVLQNDDSVIVTKVLSAKEVRTLIMGRMTSSTNEIKPNIAHRHLATGATADEDDDDPVFDKDDAFLDGAVGVSDGFLKCFQENLLCNEKWMKRRAENDESINVEFDGSIRINLEPGNSAAYDAIMDSFKKSIDSKTLISFLQLRTKYSNQKFKAYRVANPSLHICFHGYVSRPICAHHDPKIKSALFMISERGPKPLLYSMKQPNGSAVVDNLYDLWEQEVPTNIRKKTLGTYDITKQSFKNKIEGNKRAKTLIEQYGNLLWVDPDEHEGELDEHEGGEIHDTEMGKYNLMVFDSRQPHRLVWNAPQNQAVFFTYDLLPPGKRMSKKRTPTVLSLVPRVLSRESLYLQLYVALLDCPKKRQLLENEKNFILGKFVDSFLMSALGGACDSTKIFYPDDVYEELNTLERKATDLCSLQNQKRKVERKLKKLMEEDTDEETADNSNMEEEAADNSNKEEEEEEDSDEEEDDSAGFLRAIQESTNELKTIKENIKTKEQGLMNLVRRSVSNIRAVKSAEFEEAFAAIQL